jgi:hypothetical protein
MPIRSRLSTLFRRLTAWFSAGFVWLLSAEAVFAQIKNPVIGTLGNNAAGAKSGSLFVSYFISIWRVGINIGAIMVLIYMVWAGLEWISSAGDKGKLESARQKMTQAMIGIIILVSAFTIIGFFSNMVFGNDFNLLKLTFPTPGGKV